MVDMIITLIFIALAIVVAFGLTALVALMIADAKVVGQERKERESQQELPPHPHEPGSASFKRGA